MCDGAAILTEPRPCQSRDRRGGASRCYRAAISDRGGSHAYRFNQWTSNSGQQPRRMRRPRGHAQRAGGSKMSVRDAQTRARKWSGPPSPLPISTSPEIQKAWSGRRPGRAHNVTTDRLAAKGPPAVLHSVLRIWMCLFFNWFRATACGKTVNKTVLS